MEQIILYRDSFQNWKNKEIPKAQLILTDLPYQLGAKAFASNPTWYVGGDNANGESKNAGKPFVCRGLRIGTPLKYTPRKSQSRCSNF